MAGTWAVLNEQRRDFLLGIVYSAGSNKLSTRNLFSVNKKKRLICGEFKNSFRECTRKIIINIYNILGIKNLN